MEKKALKKVISVFAVGVIAILAIAVIAIQMSKPNGTTLAEREELLREARDCKKMSIATETQIGDYILCGIYDDDKAGIATFEPSGKGYKLQRKTLREKERVIMISEYIDGKWYQLAWFNGAETKTAKLTIKNTDNNEVVVSQDYDVSNGNIIVFDVPDNLDNFSIDFVYYDADGNKYE